MYCLSLRAQVVQARDEQTLRVQLLQAGKADEALALAGLDAKVCT